MVALGAGWVSFVRTSRAEGEVTGRAGSRVGNCFFGRPKLEVNLGVGLGAEWVLFVRTSTAVGEVRGSQWSWKGRFYF